MLDGFFSKNIHSAPRFMVALQPCTLAVGELTRFSCFKYLSFEVREAAATRCSPGITKEEGGDGTLLL